jgi:hypothetical protein
MGVTAIAKCSHEHLFGAPVALATLEIGVFTGDLFERILAMLVNTLMHVPWQRFDS